MGNYYSPTGNLEVWDIKPDGYFITYKAFLSSNLEQAQKVFTDAIQKHLDDFAMTRGYDSIISATTYASSTDPIYNAEGTYAIQLRDETWNKGNSILNAVLKKERPFPSVEDVINELPKAEWPVQRG